MSSIREISKKLNREFKSTTLAINADLIPEYKRLPLKDLGFQYPLYGGLPYGRVVTFAGKEHSGKTTAACTALAAYQEANPDKVCLYIDVEHSLDLKFQSKMTGLDLDKLVYICPESLSGEQIFDIILEYMDAEDVGMIILDSIPALVSGKDLETDMEKDTGRAGGIARSLHRFLKIMVDRVSSVGNIFIMVNQVRTVGTTFTGAAIYSEPGGDAPRYYPSVKVRFGTRTFTKADKVDLSDGEDADGFRLKFTITKNKTASVRRGGGFLTYRYDSGLDYNFDNLEVAMKYELIQRPNNMTYVPVNLLTGENYFDENGEIIKFVGKSKLYDYFRENRDFANKYFAMLDEYINKEEMSAGLLDKETLEKIIAEEKSVNKE